ncbi:hypothetical protein BGW36DRAFT_365307 [Talaromyces proteolyticus]|uniref:Granulins domain-containing protein n=1 Tax=Talaromyces proteolyticus TaxID=1131652 RepID=A0AAD4PU05_9EURO|nr:uncharacterized protein BGW36DRAFT_365307 [Talaromyces proteolyticus]KAH8689536.1 hypothetical protein BGW36DRAFT_365307 [Talaromyces proteolyticus]
MYLLFFAALFFTTSTLGDSILAFAPITALAVQDTLNARKLGGLCPASSQTACPDGIGCCPRGAACTYSSQLPVCDELCGAGPKCINGGCCQVGYVCGLTNDFCTPGPKEIAKLPAFTPTTSGPATVSAYDPTSAVDTTSVASSLPDSTLANDPTTTVRSTQSGKGGLRLSPTPSRRPASSPTTSHSTWTNTRAHNAGGVGGGAHKITKTPSPSAQATSTGGAPVLEAINTGAAFGFGWIAGLFFML